MSMVDKLSYLKRRDKLTTEDIAERAGVPVGTLNKIFAGQTKNPALRTMDSICRVFHVPIRYVLDDSVPDHCSIEAYAEQQGMFLMSPEELELFQNFRALPLPEQRSVGSLVHQYHERQPVQDQAMPSRLLPCYEPIACGRHGIFLDTWNIRTISTPVDRSTKDADFAMLLITDSLSPVYEQGAVLSVRQRECCNQELGLFFYNGEGYLRRLQHKRGEVRLVSVKSGIRDITVSDQDELRCMGVVLGSIRTFQYR